MSPFCNEVGMGRTVATRLALQRDAADIRRRPAATRVPGICVARGPDGAHYRYASKRTPGQWHDTLLGPVSDTCSCPGYAHGLTCWHLADARRQELEQLVHARPAGGVQGTSAAPAPAPEGGPGLEREIPLPEPPDEALPPPVGPDLAAGPALAHDAPGPTTAGAAPAAAPAVGPVVPDPLLEALQAETRACVARFDTKIEELAAVLAAARRPAAIMRKYREARARIAVERAAQVA